VKHTPAKEEVTEIQEEEGEVIMEPNEKPGNKIYWAPARNYALFLSKGDPETIANGLYQREIRDARGNVIQPARPLIFGENVFATDDPVVQKVIENSRAFHEGEVVICADMEDAYKRTAGRNMQRVVSAGMVTMQDENAHVRSLGDAQAEMNKHPEVTS